MTITQDFLIHKFLQHAGYPRHKKYNNVYEAGCPICREGKSWGKKRRLYFVIKDNVICCHNCGWYGSPTDFIIETGNTTFKELLDESKKFSSPLPSIISEKPSEQATCRQDLPDDCINLFDAHQLKYHKNNQNVRSCLDVIAKRRLNTAVSKPNTMWVSLTDYIHKNRLVIPFYDDNNKIVFYQTRTILKSDDKKYPKYLSKVGAEKSLFNANNVDANNTNIFIFEGPIDACFVKNGVAVAGIQPRSRESFTGLQQKQLNRFMLHKKIWVLDSQWQDEAARDKTISLIDKGENVFVWPEEYGTVFKDFNDMCTSLGRDEIPNDFILSNTYSGNPALCVLNKIKLKLVA